MLVVSPASLSPRCVRITLNFPLTNGKISFGFRKVDSKEVRRGKKYLLKQFLLHSVKYLYAHSHKTWLGMISSSLDIFSWFKSAKFCLRPRCQTSWQMLFADPCLSLNVLLRVFITHSLCDTGCVFFLSCGNFF